MWFKFLISFCIMSKLLHNGIRSVVQHRFEFYLSNRKQYISIKNCNSSISNITVGVPQGSVLVGPSNFFCIPMTCIDPQIKCGLLILGIIQQFLHPTVTLTMPMPLWMELVGVDNWLKANRLSLNVSKTSYMIIPNQKNAIDIRIWDSILTKVSTVKFLGVTLDQNLTFNDHVKNVLLKY